MHITPKNLQELRDVADQRDEVLRWCVRMEFQHRVADREKTIKMLQEEGRSLEEAERAVAYWIADGPMNIELVKCHRCRGWGWNSCENSCPTCNGTGKTHRFQMPPEGWAVGDPV